MKTAYERRIGDSSSDVCSSDLHRVRPPPVRSPSGAWHRPPAEGWAHKSRLDLVQIARQTSTVLSRQPTSKVPARQPKDKQRLSPVHPLGNCGFKEQQEEATKRNGCYSRERAGTDTGAEARRQKNSMKNKEQ